MNKDIRTCKHLPELDGSQLYSFRDYLRGNSFYTRFLNASKPLRCAKCHKKLLPPRVYEITENVCAFLYLPLLFLWREVIWQTIGYVQGILINRAHDIRVWNVQARIAGGAVALLVLLLLL